MKKWRMPIRLAGDVPVIAVFGEGEVWHDTVPQTPEEEAWLKGPEDVAEPDPYQTMKREGE